MVRLLLTLLFFSALPLWGQEVSLADASRDWRQYQELRARWSLSRQVPYREFIEGADRALEDGYTGISFLLGGRYSDPALLAQQAQEREAWDRSLFCAAALGDRPLRDLDWLVYVVAERFHRRIVAQEGRDAAYRSAGAWANAALVYGGLPPLTCSEQCAKALRNAKSSRDVEQIFRRSISQTALLLSDLLADARFVRRAVEGPVTGQ